MEYIVRRHTTEQLERALNSLAEDGWVLWAPFHVGGRDWVLIGQRSEVVQ